MGGTGTGAFGGGGAFSFGSAAPAFGVPAKPAEGDDGAEGGADDDAPAAEEECQAEFKPVVQLEEVETRSGEEDEEALVDL